MKKEDEILVEVKGLSKKFSRSLKRSMLYGLLDVGNAMFGVNGNKSLLRKDEFWAVKDINFQLRRGECLGLIGRNGAGKSTLLKILNGLIRPDEGSIVMRGKVGALIELGAGFNPVLTGRENIYVNGQLLGFSRKEIDKKINVILDFAEIGEFIDSPMQNYSSGMKVRLGFAIASQMEPDVLIIDEVLAVGDLGFVLKCFNTIDNLLEKSAVIFVSHSMPQISRICTNLTLLEKGCVVFQGDDVSKGIDLYYSGFGNMKESNIIFNRNNDAELIEIKFKKKELSTDDNESAIFGIDRLDDLIINFVLKVKSEYSNPAVALVIFDKEQRGIGTCQNENGLDSKNIFKVENGFNYYNVRLNIPRVNLSKGIYSITFVVSEKFQYKPILKMRSVCEFQIYSKYESWFPNEFEGIWS